MPQTNFSIHSHILVSDRCDEETSQYTVGSWQDADLHLKNVPTATFGSYVSGDDPLRSNTLGPLKIHRCHHVAGDSSEGEKLPLRILPQAGLHFQHCRHVARENP